MLRSSRRLPDRVSRAVRTTPPLTLKAVAVSFIGGLVSLPLTVAGALLLGGLEAFTQVYRPTAKGLSDAWPFILLMVVMIVRFARQRSAFEDKALVRA